MRVFDRIPVGAVRNADIFGSSTLKEGERVVDIAVDIENLPMSGKIVVKESNVIAMARKLKYGMRKPDEEAELQEELERLRTIEAEHTKLKDAIAHV